MKAYHRLILYALTLIPGCLMAQPQQTWHFEDASLKGAAKNQPSVSLNFTGRTASPELVKGVKGKGLRTDGYSVWLAGEIPRAQNGKRSLNGYFALETFPTDTSGFFTVKTGDRWISACVDRFGQLMVGISAHKQESYYPASKRVERFKWLHISLRVTPQKAELLLNNQLVNSVPLSPSTANDGQDSLMIGRDRRQKQIGILPVNTINGIIDEFSIADGSGKTTSGLFDLNLPPVLAVPSSRFENDFTRPRYHLLPAANWTNETHGLIYYKGLYHVFNQKNGANLFLGQINWGHYSSPDLISWTEHKPILTPEPGYDQNGIWSGCIIQDEQGKPTIFYSAGGEDGINVSAARPSDESLNTWDKYIGNPVIKANPKEFTRDDFHDPIVWKADGTWYMGVGFGLREKGIEAGTILLYKSADLKKWEYLHPLFTGDPENDDSGVFWEMPLFWKLNGKYVLLVNKVPVRGKPAVALYWTGDFVHEKFVPDDKQPKRLEVINRLLSPSVALDAQGNTTAIAIIPDETSARETYSRGWTHLYSIPRTWKLQNGKILQQPHPALAKLRGLQRDIPAQQVDSTTNLLISEGKQQVEIEIEFLPGDATQFGLNIGKNADGSEGTRIYFDKAKEQLVIDQTKSSLRKFVPLQVRSGKYTVPQDAPLKLRLFIDGSVVEGFINDQDAFTTRLFPLSKNSDRVEVFAKGGKLRLTKITTWDLKSSNNQTAF